MATTRKRNFRATILMPLAVSMVLAFTLSGIAVAEDLKVLWDKARDGYAVDPKFKIDLKLEGGKEEVTEGDEVTLIFKSDKDCFLTLLAMNSGDEVVQLFPNEWQSSNTIKANEEYRVPPAQSGFKIVVKGQADRMETVMAIATTKPLKVAEDAPKVAEGKFKRFKNPRALLKDLIATAGGGGTSEETGQMAAVELQFWSSAKVDVGGDK